jgi:hypothetical protein
MGNIQSGGLSRSSRQSRMDLEQRAENSVPRAKATPQPTKQAGVLSELSRPPRPDASAVGAPSGGPPRGSSPVDARPLAELFKIPELVASVAEHLDSRSLRDLASSSKTNQAILEPQVRVAKFIGDAIPKMTINNADVPDMLNGINTLPESGRGKALEALGARLVTHLEQKDQFVSFIRDYSGSRPSSFLANLMAVADSGDRSYKPHHSMDDARDEITTTRASYEEVAREKGIEHPRDLLMLQATQIQRQHVDGPRTPYETMVSAKRDIAKGRSTELAAFKHSITHPVDVRNLQLYFQRINNIGSVR